MGIGDVVQVKPGARARRVFMQDADGFGRAFGVVQGVEGVNDPDVRVRFQQRQYGGGYVMDRWFAAADLDVIGRAKHELIGQ